MQLELLERPAELTRAQARRNAMRAAKERAQLGMDRAAGAAEFDMPGWIEQAIEALRQAVCGQIGVFTIEQIRAVLEPTLPAVPELRAWGRVTQLAADRGYIEAVPRTFIPAASSNATFKPAWKRGPNA
jgi:hypothetical protein